MKSTKITLCIAIFSAVLLGQIVYLFTIYKDDKACIAANRKEIKFIEKHIEQLNESVETLPETKKELEIVTAQKMAIFNTIPTFVAGSKEGVELFRYMNLNDFVNTSFKAITEENYINTENELILNRSYELNFVGRYEEVQGFIDNLNRSYQIINIKSLELSNEVQDLTNERNLSLYYYFGEDFNRIVEATMKLTMYTRQGDLESEEIYQPDLDMRTNREGAFSLIQKEEVKVSPSVSKVENVPVEKVPIKEATKDLFTLNVGDILTSGDTYKFGGPGENGGGYVGLITESNVDITLVVRDDSYDMIIENINGEKNEVTIQAAITEPEMNIISTMRAIYDVMPSIHVYVDNKTSELMKINVSGNLTECIYVFNEVGEQVSKGQTKGNIKLT